MWYLYDKTWTVTDVPQPWSSKEFARNLHRPFLIYSFFIEIMLFWNEELFSMWFLLILEMDFWLQESLSMFFTCLFFFLFFFFISSQDNQDIKMKGRYQQAELTDDGFLKRSQSYRNDSDRSAQTMQTQISQSRVYTVCNSLCIFLDESPYSELPCSNFRAITANFSSVWIFRIFTVGFRAPVDTNFFGCPNF